jgi:hypothetical protein
MIKVLNFSVEKELALELVQRIRRELPPSVLEKGGKGITVNKITRVLERTYIAAINYQKEKGLNFIRRVILVHNFKWTLRNNNYSPEFIDMATEGLVVSLSKKNISESAK